MPHMPHMPHMLNMSGRGSTQRYGRSGHWLNKAAARSGSDVQLSYSYTAYETNSKRPMRE